MRYTHFLTATLTKGCQATTDGNALTPNSCLTELRKHEKNKLKNEVLVDTYFLWITYHNRKIGVKNAARNLKKNSPVTVPFKAKKKDRNKGESTDKISWYSMELKGIRSYGIIQNKNKAKSKNVKMAINM